MLSPTTAATVLPSERDAKLAHKSSAALALLLNSNETSERNISLHFGNSNETNIDLPFPAVHLLFQALQEIAKGNSVRLQTIASELTTQEAARLIGVSRPTLIRLLDTGAVPFRRTNGTHGHRRIARRDALAYLRADLQRRRHALDELAADADAFGFFDN